MEFKYPAVVLGTDSPASLAIIRNLGRRKIRIITMDSTPSPYGVSKYTAESLIVPSIEKEEQLLKAFADYGAQSDQKPVLLAATEKYSRFLDRHMDELKNDYLFPMEKNSEMILSPIRNRSDAEDGNYDCIPERIDLKDEDLLRRVPLLLGYPCLLKCKDSEGFKEKFRENFLLIKNESDLLDKLHAIKHYGYTQECFFEAVIPGPEDHDYTATFYYGKDSKLKGYLTAETIRKYPHTFGKVSYSKQKWIPELVNLADPLFKESGFRGILETKWKRNEFSRKVYLLSAEPIFTESTEMHCHLGFETPYMYYMDALGEDIPETFLDHDTHCHWKNKERDLSAIYHYLKNDQMNFVKIISDYKFRKTNSTWAWDDMSPGLNYFGHMVEKGVSALWRKIRKQK